MRMFSRRMSRFRPEGVSSTAARMASVADEAGEGVDVSIGVVPFQSLFQPEDVSGAERRFQNGFHLLFSIPGVRFGLSRTDSVVMRSPSELISSAPPSQTIGMGSSSFSALPRDVRGRCCRHPRAGIFRPGVVGEIDDCASPVASFRTKTGPWSRHQTSLVRMSKIRTLPMVALASQSSSQMASSGAFRGECRLFKAGDGGCELRKNLPDFRHGCRPGGRIVRPAHEDSLLIGSIRRHGESEIRGGGKLSHCISSADSDRRRCGGRGRRATSADAPPWHADRRRHRESPRDPAKPPRCGCRRSRR